MKYYNAYSLKEGTTGQVALNYAVRKKHSRRRGKNVLQAVSFGVGNTGQR